MERKLPPQKRTKTGYSTDTTVLEELAPLDPVPQLILRQRTLAKLKNTYVDTLAELAERTPSGRVHTTYIQTGAATGRLSSKDPNLQNIPIRDEEGRRIRASFTAAPGQRLISADYSQIELVVMAHLSGDANLIAAFKEGVDIHKRTAAFIFGIDEAAVTQEHRRVAKTINFGVIYGMSAFRLARDLGIPNAKAQGFIDAYFTTYSGVAGFIQKTIAETEASGYSTTMFGRRRKIDAINSRNKTERQAAQRVAVNTPIQGSGRRHREEGHAPRRQAELRDRKCPKSPCSSRCTTSSSSRLPRRASMARLRHHKEGNGGGGELSIPAASEHGVGLFLGRHALNEKDNRTYGRLLRREKARPPTYSKPWASPMSMPTGWRTRPSNALRGKARRDLRPGNSRRRWVDRQEGPWAR